MDTLQSDGYDILRVPNITLARGPTRKFLIVNNCQKVRTAWRIFVLLGSSSAKLTTFESDLAAATPISFLEFV